jgi:hypothetical protein
MPDLDLIKQAEQGYVMGAAVFAGQDGSPPISTAATSAASGASPRRSNTASSAICYLDSGLTKMAAIAWYRLPFETVAVGNFDEKFLSMHSSKRSAPGATEGRFSKHRKSRCGRVVLSRARSGNTPADHQEPRPAMYLLTPPPVIPRLLRISCGFRGQGPSHLF